MVLPAGPEITSIRSPRVRGARQLAKRAFRQRARSFLAEGPQAVGEALSSGATITELFVTAPARDRCAELAGQAARGGAAVHAVSGQISERPVGLAEVVRCRGDRDVQPLGQGEELGRVASRVRGDTAHSPFLEQVLGVVQRRDVGQVDAGDRERAAPVQRGQRGRHQIPDGGEQDGRVERLGRRVVGTLRRGSAEGERQIPGGRTPGEHVHGRALGDGDLRGEVRRPAEAIDAQGAAGRQLGPPQRTVANDPGAQQRREFRVTEPMW